jgi:hypothetical protein
VKVESHHLPLGRTARGVGRIISSRKPTSGKNLEESRLRADQTQLSFSSFASGENLALNMALSVEIEDGKVSRCRIPQQASPIPVNTILSSIRQPAIASRELGFQPISGFHPRAQFFAVLAEHDTLRFQSEELIKKARATGMAKRLEVFRAPGMLHGLANFPEHWLRARPFRIRMEAYKVMNEYWDQIVSGRSRTLKMYMEGEVIGLVGTIRGLVLFESM